MATPKPGEIRCPTCHRSTPPAAFCTQCGSAIPSDARIRPRGMDRDELQDRIRARRSGAEPYRRGASADDPSGGYERFQPEPTDAQAARRAADRRGERRADYFEEAVPADADEVQPRHEERRDLTRDREEWGAPIATAGSAAAGASWAASRDEDAAHVPEPARVDNYAEPAYDDEAGDDPYEYDEWHQEPERRSSGAGAFAILGFLALGVLALLGGAVLAGVFGDNGGVAQESPTPSLTASLAPVVSVAPSVAPSAAASEAPTGSGDPVASGEPVVFDDGATFEVQACATNEMSFSGCAQEAEFFSGGSFVAWVGFQNANGGDTLLLVLRQNGAAVADSDFPLGGPPFGCGSDDCDGYARQGFTGLPPGEYTVELLRNGEPAHTISIGVD